MANISIFGVLSTVQMMLHTALKGTYVGTDAFGNKYYRAKPRKGYNHERRWVMYAKKTEAAQVPAEWHGWLHHQTNDVPAEVNANRKPWIKPHQNNLTGTDAAYMPPPLKGKPRAAATGDYVAWQPPK